MNISASGADAVMSTSAGVAHSASSVVCFHKATVQSGTTSSSANGTVTVTLGSAVDMSTSFLLFSVASNLNRPPGSEVMGRLASTTTVEFQRVTDETATINIRWSVVSYNCGVSVQRGSVVPNTATTDVTISAVPALSQAFVTWSKTPAAIDQTWDQNDPMVADLTTTTNLQIRQDQLNVGHVIWWQVIAFTDPTTISVQRGTTSLTAGGLSTTATISAVTTAHSFVLVGARSSSNFVDIGSGMVRGRLTNSTTVTLDRAVGGNDVTEIAWQVVELNDGSTTQAGTANFPAATGTVTAAISAVTLARSTVFASTQTGGGQNGGRTSYVSDDIIGSGAATLSFNSTTQISLTRNNTSGVADIAWFVVQWGRP